MLFKRTVFIETFDITVIGDTHYGIGDGLFFYPLLLHLQSDQFAGQGDDAHIKAGAGVYYDHIAGLGRTMLMVAEKLFSCSFLETDLYDIGAGRIFIIVLGQPIIGIHLIASAGSAVAVVLATVWGSALASGTSHSLRVYMLKAIRR